MNNNKPLRQSEYIIRMHAVDKFYQTSAGSVAALKNVDLFVEAGEFLAIIGKSGAGKTTLMNVLTSIDKPTKGEIYIAGEAVHNLAENQKGRWLGKTIGIVFQFFQLLPTLNLIENVTMPMDFCNSYPLAKRKQRALDLLEQVGLIEHAYKIPAKISGGQQQRVAIARALANDPPIIIADEPTGNLDTQTAENIYDLFSLLVEQGKTLLVVSHDAEVLNRATRAIEITDGKLVEKLKN